MALSLALHGLAVVLLFAAGASGSSTASEAALLVELAFASPAPADAAESPADAAALQREVAPERPTERVPEQPIELAPAEQPPPVDLSTLRHVELAPSQEPPPIDFSELRPIELAPAQEPPPLQASELKPIQPAKPAPPSPRPGQARPAAKQAASTTTAAHNFGNASRAQQAAAGFLPAPVVVWEGKPRYRHPPTPPVYPARAIELNQQGEVLVRVRLDPDGMAVEIVLHRGSGFQVLDRAALAAVRGWHFLPAMRDGRPVAAWVEIPVRFHLR